VRIALSDLSIIPFDPNIHDVSGFRCDDEDLEEFIREDAAKYQEHHISFTRVVYLKATHELVGYVTLSADCIVLKSGEKRKLVNFYQSVLQWPALKIGRLAVVTHRQKIHGVGTSILQFSIGVALRMGAESGIGCRFITVDAYPKSISWYQEKHFVFNKHYHEPAPVNAGFIARCKSLVWKEKKNHPSMRYDIIKSPKIT
jgi:hypothetical protein